MEWKAKVTTRLPQVEFGNITLGLDFVASTNLPWRFNVALQVGKNQHESCPFGLGRSVDFPESGNGRSNNSERGIAVVKNQRYKGVLFFTGTCALVTDMCLVQPLGQWRDFFCWIRVLVVVFPTSRTGWGIHRHFFSKETAKKTPICCRFWLYVSMFIIPASFWYFVSRTALSSFSIPLVDWSLTLLLLWCGHFLVVFVFVRRNHHREDNSITENSSLGIKFVIQLYLSGRAGKVTRYCWHFNLEKLLAS